MVMEHFCDKLVLTKLSDTEDMEAFLTTFERVIIVTAGSFVKLAPQRSGCVLGAHRAKLQQTTRKFFYQGGMARRTQN